MLVIVTLGGTRPEAIREASTPNLDQIVRDSAFTFSASGIDSTVTLPCNQSIFRSVAPTLSQTGKYSQNRWRKIPSLFDIAHQSGLRTAMFTSCPPLRDVAQAESIDVLYCESNPCDPASGLHLANMALSAAHREQFDLMHLYLGHTDWCGNDCGWLSDEYVQSISENDRAIGHFSDALLAMHEPVNFIIHADHGGSMAEHASTLPLICWGYRFKSNFDLGDSPSLLDIAPTAANLLGLVAPSEWQGTPVLAAFRDTIVTTEEAPPRVFQLETD